MKRNPEEKKKVFNELTFNELSCIRGGGKLCPGDDNEGIDPPPKPPK